MRPFEPAANKFKFGIIIVIAPVIIKMFYLLLGLSRGVVSLLYGGSIITPVGNSIIISLRG